MDALSFLLLIPAVMLLAGGMLTGDGQVLTWGIVLTLISLAGMYLGGPYSEMVYNAKRKKEAAEKAEAYREAHRREDQERYYKQMLDAGSSSVDIFESIPQLLLTAEAILDQAEIDFSEEAFSPFWESVEKAAKALARFDECVRMLKYNLSRYSDVVTRYDGAPPAFPLAPQSIMKLGEGVGTDTAKRMKAVVRTAQRDFRFATIYEQHRTNDILVAGFTHLADALDGMGWRITESISALADSVGVMTSTVDESMRAIHHEVETIGEATGRHHDELMRGLSDVAARQTRVVELLDDIQRGRRPSA